MLSTRWRPWRGQAPQAPGCKAGTQWRHWRWSKCNQSGRRHAIYQSRLRDLHRPRVRICLCFGMSQKLTHTSHGLYNECAASHSVKLLRYHCMLSHQSSCPCRFVSQTANLPVYLSAPGSSSTSVSFNQCTQVLLQAWPSCVTLKLYESPKPTQLFWRPTTKMLTEIPLNVPGAPGEAPAENVAHGYEWESLVNAGTPVLSAGADQQDSPQVVPLAGAGSHALTAVPNATATSTPVLRSHVCKSNICCS